MKEMAQVLHHLNVRLKDEESWMEKYDTLQETPEDGDEYVTKGIIEALEFAIKQIEEAMEQSQKAEAVNQMTNYLLTGDRGEHGVKESN